VKPLRAAYIEVEVFHNAANEPENALGGVCYKER
jgi:hypothetical protein